MPTKNKQYRTDAMAWLGTSPGILLTWVHLSYRSDRGFSICFDFNPFLKQVDHVWGILVMGGCTCRTITFSTITHQGLCVDRIKSIQGAIEIYNSMVHPNLFIGFGSEPNGSHATWNLGTHASMRCDGLWGVLDFATLCFLIGHVSQINAPSN